MRRDDGRPGPHRQRGEKPVVHGLEAFRATTTIDHLLSVCMGRVLGRFASSVEAPKGTVLVVEQHDLVETDADLRREVLQLLDELRPAEVLRDDHVVPAGKVIAGHCQREASRHEAGFTRILAPPANEFADPVDIQVEGQRELLNVHPSKSRLAAPRRSIQKDQPRHGPSLGTRSITALNILTSRGSLVDGSVSSTHRVAVAGSGAWWSGRKSATDHVRPRLSHIVRRPTLRAPAMSACGLSPSSILIPVAHLLGQRRGQRFSCRACGPRRPRRCRSNRPPGPTQPPQVCGPERVRRRS